MMACRSVCRIFYRRLASSAAEARISTAELRRLRSAVFSQEQARQRALITRTEKIEVAMQGPGLQGTLLIMNKGVSTPHSCAHHLTEWHVKSSALALVDGELWPMHRPLTQSCSLSLLTFKAPDPVQVNKAYWRSCAALLGQVLENAFKEEFTIELLRSPELPVNSGAFCCDLLLDPLLDAWTPSEEALRSLTRDAQQLIQQNLPWEPLDVSPAVALKAFAHDRCKQEEVEELAAGSPWGTVTLYRCGDHVLLSGGPLVARTGLCSQYEVTAIHALGQGERGLHRRAQGLSLPIQLQAHHTIWRKLRRRAERLVEEPKTTEASPPAIETSPLATEATPPVAEATPQAAVATAPATEALPLATEATPLVAEATPQAAVATAPANEASPLATEATPPVAEATTPVTEATPQDPRRMASKPQ